MAANEWNEHLVQTVDPDDTPTPEESPAPEAKQQAPEPDGQGAEPAPEGETQEAQPQGAGKDKPDGDEDEAGGGRKRGTAKFIRKLKTRARQLEAENEALRRLVAERLAQQQEAERQQPQKTPEATRPEPGQFDTYEEYVDALTDWKLEQKLQQTQREQPSEEPPEPTEPLDPDLIRQQATLVAAQEAWREAIEEAKSRYEDFEQKVLDPNLPVNEQMALQLMLMEDGADVAYWLANHRDAAASIATLQDPVQIASALGRISARIELEHSAEPARGAEPDRQAAQATTPPPQVPVIDRSGTTASAGGENPEKMSIEQWMEWRRKQRMR